MQFLLPRLKGCGVFGIIGAPSPQENANNSYESQVPEDSIYVRTLWRALEILGGEDKLARHLRVPATDLREWLTGMDMPPMAYFLMAVDVVEEAARRGAGDKPENGEKRRR